MDMEIVVIGTVKIQPYIFGSNRLRENIGASFLVNEATSRWVEETLTQPHNLILNTKNRIQIDDNKRIEHEADHQDAVKAEVVYMGGGNAVILFKDEQEPDTDYSLADAFIHRYTRHILQHAPDLQVITAQHKFNWTTCDDEKKLSEEVLTAFEKLSRVRHTHAPSAPLLGLGVTAVCQSTGLPAVAIAPTIGGDETTQYPISAAIQAKLEAIQPQTDDKGQPKLNKADERLRHYLPPHQYLYPRDFDDMGRSEGEHSYIAIVHADGDGIGDITLTTGQGQNNRDYIKAQRAFSQTLDDVAQAALEDMLRLLLGRIKNGEIKSGNITIKLKQTDSGDRYYLPFRPIVFGGDDITFVCDGRLGISLALLFMEAFEKQAQAHQLGNGKPLTASAGVAIVKSHYPFARAYDLVTELTHSAKDYRKQQKVGHGGCLDWHFATAGLLGDLELVRSRQYGVRDGRLTLRPISYRHQTNKKMERYRSWAFVKQGIQLFTDKDWRNKHNKVKALQTALRQGSSAVVDFSRIYQQPIGTTEKLQAEFEPFKETGWHDRYCGYYDALELVDWFIDLEEVSS